MAPVAAFSATHLNENEKICQFAFGRASYSTNSTHRRQERCACKWTTSTVCKPLVLWLVGEYAPSAVFMPIGSACMCTCIWAKKWLLDAMSQVIHYEQAKFQMLGSVAQVGQIRSCASQSDSMVRL